LGTTGTLRLLRFENAGVRPAGLDRPGREIQRGSRIREEVRLILLDGIGRVLRNSSWRVSE